MSYILDALRKADAERERGGLPGLKSQTALPTLAAPPRPVWPWALVGVLVLAAAGAWWLLGRAPSPPVTAAATPGVPAPPAEDPSGAAPLARPAAGITPQPLPVPELRPRAEAPRPAERAPVPPVQVPVAASPALAPPASGEVPPGIVAYDRLPEDIRRQIPPVAINGAVHAQRPADRLLIVAGQLAHEGDAVAPGVVLEQIRPRSAVLRWKDVRYEVSF